MRSAHFKAILSTCAFCALAFGQTPAQSPPDQPVTTPQPMTPEQRAKQIRMYDPLDKSNPLLLNQEQTTQSQGLDAAGVGSTEKSTTSQAPSALPSNEPRPLPGSVAASNLTGPVNPRSAGPQVVQDGDQAPAQDYSGPAVLSRSYTISRPMVPRAIKWTPSLGYAETYDAGLTGAAVMPGGTLGNKSAFGYSATWGLSGRHFWKHDQLGLDYRGSANRYGGYAAYNGTNQTVNLDYTHAVSRHLSLNIVSSGSILSQSYSLDNPATGIGSSVANLDLAASPNVQVLDQGTRQWTNQAGITWQKSARLSFTASGSVFFVQRTGAGIYGNTGYQAQADVNYRYTRKMTVGVYYSFTDYAFSHRINLANFHTVGGIYSYALTRSTQIRLRAGITHIENSGLQTITIDPAIALLLGQSSGVVEAYHVSSTSDISAQFVKDFGRQRSLNFSYARGISPGNGLLLTSVQENYGGGFSMYLFRRYLLTLGGGKTSLSSAAQTAGKYDSQFYNAALSRSYGHGLTGNFQVDYRKFDIIGQPLLQRQLRISTGISWSPPRTDGR